KDAAFLRRVSTGGSTGSAWEYVIGYLRPPRSSHRQVTRGRRRFTPRGVPFITIKTENVNHDSYHWETKMMSSKNIGRANSLRRKQALIASDLNPNHKYIQQYPTAPA